MELPTVGGTMSGGDDVCSLPVTPAHHKIVNGTKRVEERAPCRSWISMETGTAPEKVDTAGGWRADGTKRAFDVARTTSSTEKSALVLRTWEWRPKLDFGGGSGTMCSAVPARQEDYTAIYA